MKRLYFALLPALLFAVTWLPAQAQGTEAVPAASPSALHQDRLPAIPAGKLTEEQKKASEEFVTIRKQAVFGPFAPLLRSPELMVRLATMGEYLRYRTSLPPRLS
jgi:4-carboxymuconolactone decarboxylase